MNCFLAAPAFAPRRDPDPNIYFVPCGRLGILEICRKISLTRKQLVLISILDFAEYSARNLYASWNTDTQSYYAKFDRKRDGVKKCVPLHKAIYERAFGPLPPGKIADHRNKISLDCRRSNLREADKSDNMHNSGIRRNNTSGYKGVCWNKRARKWKAQIMVNRIHIDLGFHATPEKAHIAYCKAAEKYHGEFARVG